MIESVADRARFTRRFLTYAGAAAVIVVLSWPVVLSFDLWVLKDRGSLLNADVLLDEHLRLGVDTFYAYGLLPILVQRIAFHAFGRGAWPMIGLNFVYLLGMAAFCASFRPRLPDGRIWTIALLALSPVMFWVNPTFPYCFVVLSMLFALLFVLERRYDIALAVATIGCVSVPSIPIVLALSLGALIVIDWFATPGRKLRDLVRNLVPGIATYLALLVLSIVVFGWSSTIATLTPLSQLGHYRAAHYDNVLAYLQIGKHILPWYFGNRPAWWMFGTLVLLVAAGRSAASAFALRRFEPVDAFLITCAFVHVVFFAFAYGPGGQHVIYDPLLVIGVLVGLTRIAFAPVARYALLTFLVLGVVSDAIQVKKTVAAWKNTTPATAGLYADRKWIREWDRMLARYTGRNILVLSYSTAPHVYFPQIHSPDLWTLNVAQLTAGDRRRLLVQVASAQVVVEDLTSSTGFVDGDGEIQRQLRTMCLVSVTKNMQIWQRRPDIRRDADCLKNPRAQSPFGGVRAG